MGSNVTSPSPKIGDKLSEMNKARAFEGTLSKLFPKIVFYVLFPGWGISLNKQMGKRERVGKSPSTSFKNFRYLF